MDPLENPNCGKNYTTGCALQDHVKAKKKIQFKGASVEEGSYVGGSGGVDRADLLVSNKVGFMGLQLFALQTCDTFIGSHYVPQWTQQQAHLLCIPIPSLSLTLSSHSSIPRNHLLHPCDFSNHGLM